MTTVDAPTRCERCHRKVRKTPPVWWFGKPYGSSCAARYGLRPERQIRVRQPVRAGLPEQPSLFDGLGELDGGTEINEESEEPT